MELVERVELVEHSKERMVEHETEKRPVETQLSERWCGG